MANPVPIIFKITNAGLNAALDAQSNGLKIKLSKVAVGLGKYNTSQAQNRTELANQWGEFPLAGAGIEPDSKTLRFSAIIQSSVSKDVFEIGLFTDANILFAVASRTGNTPLFNVSENVDYIGAFGLTISGVPTDSVQVVVDTNQALAIALMQQHLAQGNPHPQYTKNADFAAHVTQNQLEHNNIIQLIAGEVQARHDADDQQTLALNQHKQQNQLEHNNILELISAESQVRYNADQYLTTSINISIASEAQARYDGDQFLIASVDALAQAAENRAQQVQTASQNADNLLSARIDAETQARINGDQQQAQALAAHQQQNTLEHNNLANLLLAEGQLRYDNDVGILAQLNSALYRIQTLENQAIAALQDIKIGDLFITKNNFKNGAAVTDHKGYGKWKRTASGQALVGQAFDDYFGATSFPWLYHIGQMDGQYQHILSVEELPEFQLKFENTWAGTSPPDVDSIISQHDIGWQKDGAPDTYFIQKTKKIGGDKPHFNTQPSLVVGAWERMPDNWNQPTGHVRVCSDPMGNNQIKKVDDNTTVYLVFCGDNVPDGTVVQFVLAGATSWSASVAVTNNMASVAYVTPNFPYNAPQEVFVTAYSDLWGYFDVPHTHFTILDNDLFGD